MNIKFIKKTCEEIFANLISIPLILLSWIVPKKRRLILLTSSDGTEFKDNPKYFYLYLLRNKKNQDTNRK
jgi:CDP-glycerol glycerophosphotransferase (TagB/SpsB family)